MVVLSSPHFQEPFAKCDVIHVSQNGCNPGIFLLLCDVVVLLRGII